MHRIRILDHQSLIENHEKGSRSIGLVERQDPFQSDIPQHQEEERSISLHGRSHQRTFVYFARSLASFFWFLSLVWQSYSAPPSPLPLAYIRIRDYRGVSARLAQPAQIRATGLSFPTLSSLMADPGSTQPHTARTNTRLVLLSAGALVLASPGISQKGTTKHDRARRHGTQITHIRHLSNGKMK